MHILDGVQWEHSASKEAENLILAVETGMWPFKPHTIEISVDYDIDFNRYWVRAEARGEQFKNYWCIAHKEPVDRDALLDYPNHANEQLFIAFVDAFRNRVHEDEVITDNITLGEE